MARPALPKNIHILKGTAKKDPARMRARENEPENKNPLGRPPTWLTAGEKKFWRIIQKESIDGVLGEADRQAVALASRLMFQAAYDDISSAKLNQLTKLLGQFGMTPSERSKISIPKQKEKNRFDD